MFGQPRIKQFGRKMAPKVKLVTATDRPFDTAIAAARTCYSSRIITAAEVGASEASRAQRDRIAQSTFQAGHHTVWQHANFTFVLEDVSRHMLWSFLHAHPFYNSEQVSQRYVEVKPGRYVVPALPAADEALFRQTVDRMHACYAALCEDLAPTVQQAYFGVFPARLRRADTYTKDIRKKAQEVARYVLPVATHAHLYHTISALTLYRYRRLCQQWDVPTEARALVDAMVSEVRGLDASALDLLEDPIPLEQTLEYQVIQELGQTGDGDGGAFCAEFDAALGGRTSKLLSYSRDGEAIVAQAVRDILALPAAAMDDSAAIDRVLDPALNPYLGESLNLLSTAKLTRALHHATYTFRKKLSHTADSQDQRHRMTPGSRPILSRQVDLQRVDVVIPPLMEKSPIAKERFLGCMEEVWAAMRTLRDHGAPAEAWSYLLPNAFPVRFTETGDLLHQHHKWTTRLCFTAQEEIWRASVDEVEQVRELHPRLGKWLLPPCGLRQRAGVTPFCPEGTRYCGVPVWKQDVGDYDRLI